MTASSACTSGASGVVKPVLISSAPIMVATVPISPGTRPAAASPARIRKVVVVLPLVPVTPSIDIAAAGWPYTWAAIEPSTARTAGTTSTGTSTDSSAAPALSVSTATAPAATASAAKETPCVARPGSAANRSPDRTCPLAAVMPRTSTAAPRTVPRSPASSASRTGATRDGRGSPSAELPAPTSADVSGQVPAVHAGAVLQRHVLRPRTGGRDVRVLHLVARDLVEERRGDIAALEAVRGVVDHDRHHELGVVGGDDAGEGVPEHPARVCAAMVGIGLLRGAGLAGDPVTRDRRLHAGASGQRHRLEHGAQRVRGRRLDHLHRGRPPRRAHRAVGVRNRRDDARRDPHPVVRDRLVDRGELKDRHALALPEGQVRERRRRPVAQRRHVPAALAG